VTFRESISSKVSEIP